MDVIELLRLIGAVAGSAVLTKLLDAWFNRRKMSADAVDVIQKAAGGVVERIEADNTRLRSENTTLERHNDLLVYALRDQNSYSWRLAQEVRRLGGTVPDPPELPDEIKHY